MTQTTQNSITYAKEQDQSDPLQSFREKFHIPTGQNGEPIKYFCGNSLGLQPKGTQEAVDIELEDWRNLAVEGHFEGRNPWYSYHELLTEPMARLTGALPEEVVVMNTLSVNLHLMMVSFYQPTAKRFKILVEEGAFPSDQFAVASQAEWHGYSPQEAILKVGPRPGEEHICEEDILDQISKNGDQIALVLLGNVHFRTGQYFDIQKISEAAHEKGCRVGFDLAHGVGNLHLKLHDWEPDFAVWCNYKYLNAGPGGLGGCFVHKKHANDTALPKLKGWWGHNKVTRFKMETHSHFDGIQGAESWQLSNPPILPMAALKASLTLFDEAGIENLRKKSVQLTGYLETLLKDRFQILTPSDPEKRGAQLTVRVTSSAQAIQKRLARQGIICDVRGDDLLRLAPVPLYNSFEDVFCFAEALSQ